MRCPVCAYPDMPYPPVNYNICPCCGTEFGNDDAFATVDDLRDQWVAHGANWFFGAPPLGWNPWLQLMEGWHPEVLPVQLLQVSVRSVAETVGTRKQDK